MKKGETFLAVVTHAISPLSFFILDSDWGVKSEKVIAKAIKRYPLNPIQPDASLFVANWADLSPRVMVPSQVKKANARAKLIRFEQRQDKVQVLVQLLDHGAHEWFRHDQICKLPERVMFIKPLVAECQIHKIYPTQVTIRQKAKESPGFVPTGVKDLWSEYSMELFMGMMCIPGQVAHVSFVRYIRQIREVELIAFKCNGRAYLPDPSFMNYYSRIGIGDYLHMEDLIWPKTAPIKDVDHLVCDACQWGFVSHIESPDSMSLQLDCEDVQTVSESLEKSVQKLKPMPKVLNFIDILPGTVYGVKCSGKQNKIIYPGIRRCSMIETFDGMTIAKVRHDDFGTTEVTETESLYEIPEKFVTTVPYRLSVDVVLHGIEPVDSEWTPECLAYIQKVQNQFVAMVVKEPRIKVGPNKGKMSVVLLRVVDNYYSCLGGELVAMGWAKYSSPRVTHETEQAFCYGGCGHDPNFLSRIFESLPWETKPESSEAVDSAPADVGTAPAGVGTAPASVGTEPIGKVGDP